MTARSILVAFVAVPFAFVACASPTDVTAGDEQNVTNAAKSTASGYDLEGPKALPNDTAPVEFCAAVVSEVQEACSKVQGVVSAANGCAHLCSKPIAPAGKVAGYDLNGFQMVTLDPNAEPVACAAVISEVAEQCGKAGGTTRGANGCDELCSVPIAPNGQIAGFDLSGFKILPTDKVPVELCAAVLSPVREQCTKAGGKTSRANGCADLCSLPL